MTGPTPAPTQSHSHRPPQGTQPESPRVGARVILGARVVGAIPDGTKATVRVYEKGRNGDGERLVATIGGTVREGRVQVPWVVTGRPGYRTHELQLEFDVQASGKRTPRTKLPMAPERLVEVEIASGSGALEIDADLPFHVLRGGTGVDRPRFRAGERFRAELPRDYRGPIVVRSNGRPVVALRVGGQPLGPDEPIRIKGAHVVAARSFTGAASLPRPSAAVADATGVARRTGLPQGEIGEGVHVHTLTSPSPLPDGSHDPRTLSDRIYRWFIVQTFGSAMPPALVSLVQSKTILKEFGTKFYIKDGRYIIFRGSPRVRQYLTATRYRVDHPKVLLLTGGGRLGAAKALTDGVKSSAIGLFIVGALDVVEGIQKGSAWEDILVDVASDTAKGVIGTVLGVGLVAGAAALFPGIVALAPVGVVVLVGVGVGVLIGLGLDWLDEELGATKLARAATHNAVSAAAPQAHAAASWLADAWDELVVEPAHRAKQTVGRGLAELEGEILRLYGMPSGSVR